STLECSWPRLSPNRRGLVVGRSGGSVAGAVTRRRAQLGDEVLAINKRGVLRDTSLGHPVVDLQDEFLGSVGAVLLDIFPFHDRERLHDVVHIITIDPVQVEEQSVQLSPYYCAPILVPSEWLPVSSHVTHERLHVIRCIN